MSVFGDYAAWYDLFYADKDYRGETAFVSDVLGACGASGGTLLEVGSGTGAHARWFVERGWEVVGIDRSEAMLEKARQRAGGFATFLLGDVREFELERQFDAAVSLFHVMSYQAGPGELSAALRSIRRHLRRGGLFLFDFWFGPAVLAQKPERRERVVENDRFRVVRTATPTLHHATRVVDVGYHFDVFHKLEDTRQTLDEVHCMRYLMPDEVSALAEEAGFAPVLLREWMSEQLPDTTTWSAFALWRAEE